MSMQLKCKHVEKPFTIYVFVCHVSVSKGHYFSSLLHARIKHILIYLLFSGKTVNN